jgi:hypothetical protein
MEIPEEKFQKFQLFNPLDKRQLGKNVADHLLMQEMVNLPPGPFSGAGIYAIYYQGDFPVYAKLRQTSPDAPIYIGKAVPEGGRKGGQSTTAITTIALWKRLWEHAKTIASTSNLDPKDFQCRFLVVDDIWIPLAESMLIDRFAPIWNVTIEGFGIHAPGKGRSGQKKSVWDTLHPGRSFANGLPDNPKADDVIRKLV